MNKYEIRVNEFGTYYLYNITEGHALFNRKGIIHMWFSRSGAISHAKRYNLTIVK